ncbi:hypothetical protein [Polluticoccus soli]|uniref:hypothetical protein n=1 Tax=Polluticoccus soli TaxID=3034150 RepID=UPI0023E1C46B|nr:hypothetical protein [Flavipsychrobacter sp. JY13-12]
MLYISCVKTTVISFILLLVVLCTSAQDCSQLIRRDTGYVCQEQYYDLLIAGKYDEWYKAESRKKAKVMYGYIVELHKPDRNGEDISYQLYPESEPNRLYISLSVTYPYFADKLRRTKNRYEIKFSDGTLYKYDQPYSVTCAHDFYILLKGKARQLHWDVDEQKVESVTPVFGDTVLLKKMQDVPIQAITQYSAWRNRKYQREKTGREFDEYTIEHDLALPRAEAIKFMQSLQCMVKE